MKRFLVPLAMSVLFCGVPAEAQVLTGSLIGVVRDESRAVLPGVSATISSPALPGGPVNIVTDAEGKYRLQASGRRLN